MQSTDRVKRVAMTGGSSGIGLATAQAFLDEGYEVINLSRRDCPLSSPRLTSISVDLSDAAATYDKLVTAVSC
jgi:NAD(P)-dependent dehydrogenase (short-subunit alcohol dehydrogenase family)